MTRDGQVVGFVSEDEAEIKATRPYKKRATKTQRMQGKYLAAMRPLTKANRMKVRTVLKKDGHAAAISFAKTLA
jgi:hypothetical protein